MGRVDLIEIYDDIGITQEGDRALHIRHVHIIYLCVAQFIAFVLCAILWKYESKLVGFYQQ
jgi:hypothetical protein